MSPARLSVTTTDAKIQGSHGSTLKSRMASPREQGRQTQSQEHADGDLHQTLLEDERQHIAGVRAERHPNADFARSIARRERHHPIQADGRQRERRDAKRHEQSAEGPVEPGVQLELLVQ